MCLCAIVVDKNFLIFRGFRGNKKDFSLASRNDNPLMSICFFGKDIVLFSGKENKKGSNLCYR